MALALLVDSAAENPLVQKLAAWVAQGAAPPPLYFSAVCVSTSPWDAGLRAAALTTYDSSTASLTPDLKLTVVAQPKPTLTSKRAPATLLTATFTPEQAGKVASSSKGWESVPSNSSLVFAAQGSGEVSIAAALNFTPADLLPFPTYRGLWVQRAVLVEQAAANSLSSLSAAEEGIGLGKIVTVAVQVCLGHPLQAWCRCMPHCTLLLAHPALLFWLLCHEWCCHPVLHICRISIPPNPPIPAQIEAFQQPVLPTAALLML